MTSHALFYKKKYKTLEKYKTLARCIIAVMKFAPIINPDARKDTPKPLRVDLRTTFAIGTIIWFIALVVTLLLALLHVISIFFTFVSAMGFFIGIILLIWEHFDRWDYRRLGK